MNMENEDPSQVLFGHMTSLFYKELLIL